VFSKVLGGIFVKQKKIVKQKKNLRFKRKEAFLLVKGEPKMGKNCQKNGHYSEQNLLRFISQGPVNFIR
jgi:hypothetical protein